MLEYDFPSGRLTTAFDPLEWIVAIQFLFAVMLAASIVIAFWQCFRPPSPRRLAGWIALIIAEYWFFIWLWASYPEIQQPIAPYRFWMLLGPFAAMTITAFRLAKHWPVRIALGITVWSAVMFVLEPTYSTPQEAWHRSECKNHLKQIGLAMHNYHDVHRSFPSAGVMIAEKTTIPSWRITLLPYIDDAERRLFSEYHADEPWNSPHNATLQEKRPDIYRCRSHPTDKRLTSYAMLRGPGTVGSDGSAGVSYKTIRDGTSNTLLVVEACGREILWTEPKDVDFSDDTLGINLPGDQPGRSRGLISSYHLGGAHVLFGDGSVRYISEKTDPTVLKALATFDGGEQVPEY